MSFKQTVIDWIVDLWDTLSGGKERTLLWVEEFHQERYEKLQEQERKEMDGCGTYVKNYKVHTTPQDVLKDLEYFAATYQKVWVAGKLMFDDETATLLPAVYREPLPVFLVIDELTQLRDTKKNVSLLEDGALFFTLLPMELVSGVKSTTKNDSINS